MLTLDRISLKLILIGAICLFSALTLAIVLIGVDYSMHKALVKRSTALIERDLGILSRQLNDDLFINDWPAVERVLGAYVHTKDIRSLALIRQEKSQQLNRENPWFNKTGGPFDDPYFNPTIAGQVLAKGNPQPVIQAHPKRIDAYQAITIPGYLNDRLQAEKALIYFSYDLRPALEATHHELTQTSRLFIAIGSLGLLGMLLFFRRYVTEPLQILARASEQMAAGQYHLKLPVSGNNEISRLASALNRFASSSQRYIEKLQGKHRQLNNYLNSGIVGMVVLDENGIIREMNNFLTECTGYSREELIQMDWPALLHPEDRAKIAWHKRRLVKPESTSQNLSFRLHTKSGASRWIDCSIKYEPATDTRESFYVAFLRDITAKRKGESRIHQLAYYDELTQLPNRRHLTEKLAQAVETSHRYHQRGALMFIDLDFFKDVNDSLGHQVGDQLLHQVAERLRLETRKEDTLARIGGDEFVLLTPQLPEDQQAAINSVSNLGERILAAISSPYTVDGQKLHITASAGVSFFPFNADNLEDLLRQADTAMYQAKNAGRGTLRFFSVEMQNKADERLYLRNQLQQAIDEEQFELYLQPQVDVQSGAILGAECLIRWQHPDGHLVSPADFIPIAEESGLIVDIGDWVLKQACQQLQQLEALSPDANLQHLAINISPRQFHSHNFVDRVRQLISEYDINPRKLCFELTENLLVDSLDSAIAIAEELKQLGISFSIDDFGTGYSSLGYLTRLPLDEIKIDKSFIDQVPDNCRGTTIVDTIISMAQHMGTRVVAEGVESKEQLTYLREKQCEIYQGYLVSRPVAFEAFCESLLQSSEYSHAESELVNAESEKLAVQWV